MTQRFQDELAKLRGEILAQADTVAHAVEEAFEGFVAGDAARAQAVRDQRHAQERRHRHLNTECQRILALYQPVAIDLRMIVAGLKINDDLDRIHRLAEGVARDCVAVAEEGPKAEGLEGDFRDITARALSMLRRAAKAFETGDVGLAAEVCADDDAVDRLKKKLNRGLRAGLEQSPDRAAQWLFLLDAPRRMERIADLATNIAEEVIHVHEGEIARHGRGPDADPGG